MWRWLKYRQVTLAFKPLLDLKDNEILRSKFECLCVDLEILEKKLSTQVLCYKRPGEGRHDLVQRLE